MHATYSLTSLKTRVSYVRQYIRFLCYDLEQFVLSYLKPFRFGEQKIETTEPVGQDEEDVNKIYDSPQIGPDRPALYDVVILYCTINLLRRWYIGKLKEERNKVVYSNPATQ